MRGATEPPASRGWTTRCQRHHGRKEEGAHGEGLPATMEADVCWGPRWASRPGSPLSPRKAARSVSAPADPVSSSGPPSGHSGPSPASPAWPATPPGPGSSLGAAGGGGGRVWLPGEAGAPLGMLTWPLVPSPAPAHCGPPVGPAGRPPGSPAGRWPAPRPGSPPGAPCCPWGLMPTQMVPQPRPPPLRAGPWKEPGCWVRNHPEDPGEQGTENGHRAPRTGLHPLVRAEFSAGATGTPVQGCQAPRRKAVRTPTRPSARPGGSGSETPGSVARTWSAGSQPGPGPGTAPGGGLLPAAVQRWP